MGERSLGLGGYVSQLHALLCPSFPGRSISRQALESRSCLYRLQFLVLRSGVSELGSPLPPSQVCLFSVVSA